AAAIGLVVLARRRSWRETLLLAWILAPIAFFELWPVKGYQYLLPAAPPLAILAGRALAALPRPAVRTVCVTIVAISLLGAAWEKTQPAAPPSPLAGPGGLPGGRGARRWIRPNTPVGATLLTIGP